MKPDKFHGRVGGDRRCERPGCAEAGEFRAPGDRASGFDGPGDYRWFCLDHVREFNAGYDWFKGMTPEQILAAQSPIAGWAGEVRAFRPDAGIDAAPRWADFADPLDAIAGRARARQESLRGERDRAMAAARFGLDAEDRRDYATLGIGFDADRKALRAAYSALVRRFHPDRNGGDRSHEARLGAVVEAYQRLRGRPQFA